ncbi:hypothetical protein EV368DRAFT_70424 [Lentinula lateritia]|nr:hypothetical protein EV368DRAFT_70424 [Lentinula lateritia]
MHSLSIICLLSIFFASVLAAPPQTQLRLWWNPTQRVGTYLNSASRSPALLAPRHIDAPNEIWALSIDKKSYYTTFENGKWVQGGLEEYNKPAGILLGSFVVPQPHKDLLHDALKIRSGAEMDVLWIYNTLQFVESEIGSVFAIKIDLVTKYLPYMKVMLESKGSGARGLITPDEEERYVETLNHLFGNSGI